jgi:hypothetical protein
MDPGHVSTWTPDWSAFMTIMLCEVSVDSILTLLPAGVFTFVSVVLTDV